MWKLCLAKFILLTGFASMAGGLKLEGGQLKASQDPVAWWDVRSHQWVIRLTCGSFIFQGSPPLNVTWTTPEGEARFSSGYESGRFFLNLDLPVKGGNYTCTIPPHHLPLICGEDESLPDLVNASASVAVDELKARLILAAANQKTLGEMMESLELEHAHMMENITLYCQDVKEMVEEQGEILKSLQHSGQDNGQHNESQEESHSDLSGPCSPANHTEIDDPNRATSAGDSYAQNICDRDLEHGWYRFLLQGDNAVIPTTCVEEYSCTTDAPVWLDLQGQSLPEVGQQTAARACASWDDDCCNWESPITVRNCGDYFVYHLEPRDICSLAYCVERQV